MFEHVGIDNHEAFFRQMHRLLKPRGLYLHQATTRRPTVDLIEVPQGLRSIKSLRPAIFFRAANSTISA